MHVGETAVVWSHSKYAYGLGGRTYRSTEHNNSVVYELPPESNVAYEITVLSKVESLDEPETILQFTQARKEQANDQYQDEWSRGAGKTRIKQAYERIARDMEGLLQTPEGLSESVIATAHNLRIDALNNITAVLLRAGEFHAAKTAAVAVLELEPQNFKALIRAAKAALMDPSSEFIEVEKALEAAAAHADSDTVQDDLRKLTQEFTRRKQAYDQVSKQMYQKAFDANSKAKDKSLSSSKERNAPSTDAKGKRDKMKEPSATALSSDSSSVETKSKDSDNIQSTSSTQPITWRDWAIRHVLPFAFQFLVTIIMWFFLKQKRSTQTATSPQSSTSEGPSEEF